MHKPLPFGQPRRSPAAPAAFLLLALTLAACGTAPTPDGTAPGGSSLPAQSATSTPGGTFAGRVLALTNAARAQARSCGSTSFPAAAPLTANAQLTQAAQGHAADMAAKNYFSHTSQNGRTMAQRVSATGYAWRSVGENIAAGQPTPEAVVDGWLKSPGHCRNIMNASFTELGVGYAAGGSYGQYWVQDFGRR